MPALQTIYRGCTGDAVSYAQERLNIKGWHIDIDGVFGAETGDAMRQFQASQGLVPDEIIGELTWERLTTGAPVKPPEVLLADQRNQLMDAIPADVQGVRRTMLEIACKAFGLREIPAGSNGGPEIEPYVGGYNPYWGLPDEPLRSWCVMFAASCIARALDLPERPSWGEWEGHPWYVEEHPWRPAWGPGGAFRGSTSDIEAWAQERGVWTPADEALVIPAGAVFTVGGHTGIAICDNGDGTITTIEGNVSDAVGSYTRKIADVDGRMAWWKVLV